MTITTTTRVVGSTDGHRVEFQGLGVRHVLDGGQAAGAFALVEHELAPRALGSPMHAHERRTRSATSSPVAWASRSATR